MGWNVADREVDGWLGPRRQGCVRQRWIETAMKERRNERDIKRDRGGEGEIEGNNLFIFLCKWK